MSLSPHALDHPRSPPRRLPLLGAWLLAGGLAAPALLAAFFIDRFGVNGAIWDHLIAAELFEKFYTGTLTLEYLFRPHNEHIKAFARLACLALGLVTHFDNRAEMAFQWLLLGFAGGISALAIRQRAGLSRWPLAAACLPFPFILFNLRQYELLLMGDGILFYLTIAAVPVAVLLASGPRSPGRLAGAAAAAFVASFSNAAGVLLWPLGALILLTPDTSAEPASRTKSPVRITVAVSALVAAATVALYVWRLPPGAGGGLGQIVTRPGQRLAFAIAAAGAGFGSGFRIQFAAGLLTTALEIALAAIAIRNLRSGRRVPWGIWLIVFAAGCRLLLAAGRFSPDVASRYAAFMTLAAIGACAAALEIEQDRRPARRPLTAAAFLLALCGWALGSLDGWHDGHLERARRLRAVQLLETAGIQTDAIVETFLYPNAAHARVFAGILERRHLNVFATPAVDPLTLPRTSGVRYFVDAMNFGPRPTDAPLTVGERDSAQIAGWAVDQAAGRPLDRLVIVIDGGTLKIPAAYGFDRPDVAERLQNGGYNRSGFEAVFAAKILSPGDHTVALAMVTADGQRVVLSEPVAVLRRVADR